jgi:ABC-2 type transport system ATP-binding protein
VSVTAQEGEATTSPTAQTVLEVTGLTKSFGAKVALAEVDAALHAGEVVGLVGRNGAGKSTLISIAVGLARPSQGTVRVRGSIALLPERVAFVEHLSGLRNLRLLGRLRASPSVPFLQELLREVGLDPDLRTPVAKYSLGMRQRLGVAQALMERADVVVLDEPSNGLDPEGIRWLRDVVRGEAQRGAGVLISSHLLTELERSCDRVLVLDAGRIVNTWRPNDADGVTSIAVRVAVEEPLRQGCAAAHWSLRARADGGFEITADLPIGQVIRRLANSGVDFEQVASAGASIEDLLLGGQE